MRCYGVRTAEERKYHHPTVKSEGVDVLLPVRGADEVNDDVHTAAACSSLDGLAEIRRLVVRGVRHAQRAEPGQFLFRRSRGHDCLSVRMRWPRFRRCSVGNGCATTYAPKKRAIWFAATPTPEAPACTRTLSSFLRPPIRTRAWYATTTSRRELLWQMAKMTIHTCEESLRNTGRLDPAQVLRLANEMGPDGSHVVGVCALRRMSTSWWKRRGEDRTYTSDEPEYFIAFLPLGRALAELCHSPGELNSKDQRRSRRRGIVACGFSGLVPSLCCAGEVGPWR